MYVHMMIAQLFDESVMNHVSFRESNFLFFLQAFDLSHFTPWPISYPGETEERLLSSDMDN